MLFKLLEECVKENSTLKNTHNATNSCRRRHIHECDFSAATFFFLLFGVLVSVKLLDLMAFKCMLPTQHQTKAR